MKDNYKNKILVLTILTIIFTIMGSTLAFWNWNTSEAQKTLIGFTVAPNISCTGDGGGNIGGSEKKIVPTSCTNETYAIQRTITLNTSSTISTNDIFLNLWLDVVNIGEGLSNSQNFKYALTKTPNDCTTNAVTGSFNGVTKGGRVNLLKNKEYIGTKQDIYYLYIWLDSAETSTTTMNQSFELKLGGSCQDDKSPAPSEPVLDETGMIPVTIDNSGNVKTISATDENWYNYEEKQWANAILVTESSRANYLNKPNTPVTKSDILAYYVWIPRYKYRIPKSTVYKTCSDEDININDYPECYSVTLSPADKSALIEGTYYMALQEGYSTYTEDEAALDVENALENGVFNSKTLVEYNEVSTMELITGYNQLAGTSLNGIPNLNQDRVLYLLNVPREIEIEFETATNEMSTGDAINTFYTHPAFTFNEDMTGFWVGKFETTGTAKQPTILNGVSPLVSQTISAQFTSSLLFAGGTFDDTNRIITFANSPTYGLSNTTDSHMMKNSEWGAVAYLSHSKYGTCTNGICQEIRINNYYSGGPQTGCGAATADASLSSTCTLAYGSGISEYPQSTTGNITGVFDMSGGALEHVMGNYNNTKGDYWTFSNLPPTKYYDVYTTEAECTTETCGGHALTETKKWYDDYDNFVYSDYPWLGRGGYDSSGANAGAFAFHYIKGTFDGGRTWRSVLSAR